MYRDRTEILRGLTLGGSVLLRTEGWAFGPGCRLFPARRLADHIIESLLEDGLAARIHSGTALEILPAGHALLLSADETARWSWREVTKPIPIEAIRGMALELRAKNPEFDHLNIAYSVAGLVVRSFLGLPWLEKNVLGASAPTDFFRNNWSSVERKNIAMLRVIHLAEMMLNLRNVPGFDGVKKQLSAQHDIESSYAELETGKLLFWSKTPFRFGPAVLDGKNYDIEIKLGERIIAGDTKCKLESTNRRAGTLLDSLRQAASQNLPKEKPGIIFIKTPQDWNPSGTDDSVLEVYKEAVEPFFRGTGRVVSVQFYSSLALDFSGNTVPFVMVKGFTNPNHRHDKSVNWDVFSDMPETTPPNWVDIIKISE